MKTKEENTELIKTIEESIGMSVDAMMTNMTDKINAGFPLKEYPWEDFVKFLESVQHAKNTSIFILLLDTLFAVHSYSKRISCIAYLRKAAYGTVNPISIQDWETACSTLTNYYSRLRELTSMGYTISRHWVEGFEPMDELSFLLEHITADELIVLMQLSPVVTSARISIPDFEEVVLNMSRIFGIKYSAELGTYAMPSFCLHLNTINLIRLGYINGAFLDEVPADTPIEINIRNQCFDAYIEQRIKIHRDELLAADDTLPTIPSDGECLQQLLEKDKVLCDRMTIIIGDQLENKKDPLLNVDKRIRDRYSKDFIIEWASVINNSLPTVLKLMKSFVRYEETKITHLRQLESQSNTHILNINAPVGQLIANVEHQNTAKE